MKEVVRVRDLWRCFDGVDAVRGISFELGAGEIFGLVGPDGAGKTTTIRMLAGLMAPSSGEARLLGRDPMRDATVREALGLMPQSYSLYADLSVNENLSFFARLFCLDKSSFAKRRARLLDITRLGRFAERRAGALSGGMYKKLALACALLHDPKVLILDEPTNGVDPVSRRELWDLLYEFAEEGMAIVVSTAYMDEAERCHSVGLIHRGTLIARGEPKSLVREFAHQVFELRITERTAAHDRLENMRHVLSVAPAGNGLRIIVAREGVRDVVAEVREMGGELDDARASFEDVFVARVLQEERS